MDRGCFLALFKNLTFKESAAANACSINIDVGEAFFFAKKTRAASSDCLNKATAIIFVSKLFVAFLTFSN